MKIVKYSLDPLWLSQASPLGSIFIEVVCHDSAVPFWTFFIPVARHDNVPAWQVDGENLTTDVCKLLLNQRRVLPEAVVELERMLE